MIPAISMYIVFTSRVGKQCRFDQLVLGSQLIWIYTVFKTAYIFQFSKIEINLNECCMSETGMYAVVLVKF